MRSPEALAAAVWAVTWAARRLPYSREWWQAIPERWRWTVPLMVAASGAALDAYTSGAAPLDAVAAGAFAALLAIGGHHVLRDAPGPYR